MSNIKITTNHLLTLEPLGVVADDLVRSRFIDIYDTLWGAGTGESAYERESHYFNQKLRDDKNLQSCTRFSIFTCFMDLAIVGLSLEPGSKALCYLQGRKVNAGKDANNRNVYEDRLTLSISGYGELVIRERAGQIRHADNPVIVYEGDEFSYGDRNGQKVVDYMCHLTHNTNNILAAFMRITRSDGSTDYAIMLKEDWERLAGYSLKQNRKWDTSKGCYVDGKANALYSANNGTIDTGFLCAKLIKHAFKTYPKVRIGKGTMLESQQEDNLQTEIDQFYGVADAPEYDQSETDTQQQSEIINGNPSAGVVVNTSDSDDAF